MPCRRCSLPNLKPALCSTAGRGWHWRWRHHHRALAVEIKKRQIHSSCVGCCRSTMRTFRCWQPQQYRSKTAAGCCCCHRCRRGDSAAAGRWRRKCWVSQLWFTTILPHHLASLSNTFIFAGTCVSFYILNVCNFYKQWKRCKAKN